MNNGDESLPFNFTWGGPGSKNVVGVGNFHKTLPHNQYGEVEPKAYAQFVASAAGGDYENVPVGWDNTVTPPISSPGQASFATKTPPPKADKLNNPQAGRSHDKLTGPPSDYMMGPAPSVLSDSTAAEMTELQWMALLRDLPFADWPTTPDVQTAIKEIKAHFSHALISPTRKSGDLELVVDLPAAPGATKALDIRLETLFRCGLKDEDKGPMVSQFFLHDVAYGAQLISQKVRPYQAHTDFLCDHGSWLRAQSSGYDEDGKGYSDDNAYVIEPEFRHFTTMRDLARFVNKDALHQAYFNAALLCLHWKVPFDPGSPYATYDRQERFGTFGGPDLLTRVSEVASRALAVVWRQKWEVHRRLRPEAYGGLMQMQHQGHGGVKRAYGLPARVFSSEASKRLLNGRHKALFLPMAYTAGSPPHPAYGAGHATVAGACVTVLKAWLDETTNLESLLKKNSRNGVGTHPVTDRPIAISDVDQHGQLTKYLATDAAAMTIEGELNKIACNVAMGRSMGGVHWRSDNTRSLRLGEQIATELLRTESLDYAEKAKGVGGAASSWTFTSFNGNTVRIESGKVTLNGSVVDPKTKLL